MQNIVKFVNIFQANKFTISFMLQFQPLIILYNQNICVVKQ